MALQYVPFSKKECDIKRMLQSDTLKNPDFAMSAKEQLLRGVLGCFGQQREAERKREEKFEGGENMFRKFSLP